MAQNFSTTTSVKELAEALQKAGLRKKDRKIIDSDAHKIGELSAEDQKKIASEMIELATSGAKKQLKEIQKKKELKELSGKNTKVDQVDIDTIETVMEAKKGGLPDYMAALPPNHKIRLLWEEGYRAKPDGTLYKAVDLDESQSAEQDSSANNKSRMFFWGTIIVLEIIILFGCIVYNKRLVSIRQEIVKVVEKKGIPENDPTIVESYKKMHHINWLPDLADLLAAINRAPYNFSRFSDNPEPGSYLEYIKRHDKVLDAQEAMLWRAQVIRKPHGQQNKQPIKNIAKTPNSQKPLIAKKTPNSQKPLIAKNSNPDNDGQQVSLKLEYKMNYRLTMNGETKAP